MKVRRITLRNFRGVDERTVEFPASGVTVVAGRNEVGKSSLAEALDLLFDQYDSSKKKSVLAVKPVHRDEGAEIEVDVEAAPYRFTYFKRFHKKPETRLTVTQPRAESASGREAHDRVQAILEQTVDLALWRALRIEQGRALGLPAIADNASLSKALDAAAGSARADDDALTLFDRAREEFDRWFTGTGREKKELADVSAAVDALDGERVGLQQALRRLEADADRSRALEAEIAERARQLADDERRAVAAAAALRELERLQAQAKQADAEHEAARAHADAAARDVAARAALVEALGARRAALEQARAAAAAADPSATRASETLRREEARMEAARRADAAAARALAQRERDLEFRRAELDHAQLGERLARIVAAEERARTAEEVCATSRVDDAALADLREAQRAADEARIRAEAGSPMVRVEAQRDVVVRGGGDQATVPAGTTAERAALDDLVVEAPGAVRVTVRPAGDAAALRAALQAAGDRLETLLSRFAVESVADAQTVHAARQEAERALARREEVVRENLRDLTRDDIEGKLRRLGLRVDAYPAQRETVPGAEDVPASFDAAQAALDEARRSRQTAATVLEDARRAYEEARAGTERLRLEAQTMRARVEHAENDVAQAQAALDRAREQQDDERLETRNEALAQARAEAEAAARAAREKLDAARPEDVRLASEGAAAAERSTREALRAAREERAEVRARLQQAGQEGLAERLDAVESARHHARRRRDATQRRAAAARLLFETLSAQRDVARRTYVAPLRERVLRLGRLVFGATFDVEIDESLGVTQRTLDGRTVPFEDLSGGAREQLDLILRAAAAMVVSASGGVPLILDDALGYSDPERLAALGAVLTLAGEQGQVIVLTCVPDRYRHVAGAHVVRIP